jgi:DNA-binding transcriptional LysR family regulator
MDQLAALRAFVRVVEAGTFTRASTTLGMPKATVTKLIQSLEGHVRTKLLHRTTRQVTVTPDGAAYYERVVRLLADLDELDGAMTSSQAHPSGRLRVDMSSALAVLIVIPALGDFHARYPDIVVELGVSDRPVDLVGENIDCVLRGGTLTDQSLVARRIGELSLMSCASPDYLRRHGEPEHPLDLETAHYMVGYTKGGSSRALSPVFVRGNESHEVSPRHIVSVNDGNAYLAAGLAGLGILHSPSFMVGPHIEAGRLRPILPGWESGTVPLHVVYPPNRHISNRVRVFVDWIAELIAKSGLAKRPPGSALRADSSLLT